MADIPPRQVQRRIDDSAADMGTLVDLGLVEEQPVPQYAGLFIEPDIPCGRRRTRVTDVPAALLGGGDILASGTRDAVDWLTGSAGCPSPGLEPTPGLHVGTLCAIE